jgi:choline monooxygenase
MTFTLPASWYHDPSIHDRERHAIFAREWLYFGPAERLVAPGDYLADDVCGWDVVAVVTASGERRAFHNVCRHRAGPLVAPGAGHGSAFVCRYHGWVYELDGALRAARDFGEEIDAADCSLLPVRVEEWRGLVFVNLDAEAVPLVDALGDFAAACAEFPLETFRPSSERAHDIDANWKTYADNYLEGYHIPLVHPELTKQIDARAYRVDVRDRWCLQSAPARDGAPTVGKWLWRFPNLALNVYPDGMNVERFLPLGPTRARIAYSYFFADGAEDEDAIALSRQLLEEDARICEAVQRRLQAGVYERGRLSPRHEAGVAAFQHWLREAVEAR